MKLRPETKNNISKTVEMTLGIPYEEFEKLNFEEQEKIIATYRKKHKMKKSDEVIVMIGSGESALFAKVKKGEKVMVGSGEDACFVRAGISPEESRQELDDRIDDILYSKPVAFVKKLQRRIRNTNK